jgi:hypothetical protein
VTPSELARSRVWPPNPCAAKNWTAPSIIAFLRCDAGSRNRRFGLVADELSALTFFAIFRFYGRTGESQPARFGLRPLTVDK